MDRRKKILENRVDNDPERAAAIGLELHRNRKASGIPYADLGATVRSDHVKNLGKFAHPPKK